MPPRYFTSETSYATLQKTIPSTLLPPTLQQVLDVVRSPLLIELKGQISLSNLLSILTNVDESKILLQSFYPHHIRDLSDSDWDGEYGLLVPDETILDVHGVPDNSITSVESAVTFANETSCSFLSIYHKLCTSEITQLCSNNGFSVYGWTVRDAKTADKLKQSGVDGLITDSPEYVK